MRRIESGSNNALFDLLPVIGAISAGVFTYTSGISEHWASISRTVASETWATLPQEMQKITFEALKISSSCAYGAAAGTAVEKTINNWEWLNKQAVKSGLVDKFYKYHPSRVASVLR